MTYSDGRKYVGEFKDGKFHGQGTWTDSEEWEYAGEWKDHQPHGRGTKKSESLEYVGEWRKGLKNGHGTEIYTHPDDPDLSSTYVGEFKDDEYHGQGTHIWLDGIKYVGEFKEGERWEGVVYNEDGDVLSTWSKGGEAEGVEVTE